MEELLMAIDPSSQKGIAVQNTFLQKEAVGSHRIQATIQAEVGRAIQTQPHARPQKSAMTPYSVHGLDAGATGASLGSFGQIAVHPDSL